MKNIETKKEELRKEFNSKLDDILKPKFEVGKWYKLTENYAGTLKKGEVYQMINFQADSKICIILDHVAFGINGRNYLAPYKDMLIEATPKEVEEALIKEAEKRGFKEGSKIKDLQTGNIKTLKFKELSFYSNMLCDGYGCAIFENNEWATPIKTKTIDEIVDDMYECTKYDLKEYLTKNKQDIINALNNL